MLRVRQARVDNVTLSPSLTPILALARAGAGERAWETFGAAGLDRVSGDPAALSLRGRLLKDCAASVTGAGRSALLQEAAEAYAAAAALAPATYPLINAATLSLLGGAPARAAQLATETLALLDSGAHEPDTAYWLGATRAEALLLLDREVEARAALREAIAGTPRAWEDHAVTIRQFRLILAEQGKSAAWLDACAPPPTVHFAGPIGIAPDDARLESAIDAAIAAIAPGMAVGALAAGFDIVAAERLVRAGVELHVILPAAVDAFIDASVAPAGAEWRTRFDALLAAAESVETLDLPAGLSAGAAVLAEEMALGCAVRNARSFGVDTVMLRMAQSTGAADPSERAGLRRVEVAGAALGDGPASVALAAPDRPLALLGCRHVAADALAGRSPSGVRPTPTGVFSVWDDLDAAAEAATSLFRTDPDSHTVLDYAPACADGAPDSAALDALLAIPAPRYPIVTRVAALALEARGTTFRIAVAGESIGLTGAVEYFSLVDVGPVTPPDPPASGAS